MKTDISYKKVQLKYFFFQKYHIRMRYQQRKIKAVYVLTTHFKVRNRSEGAFYKNIWCRKIVKPKYEHTYYTTPATSTEQ